MTARLGSVSSDLVSVKRGMPQGAPESPDIFTLVMDMVFRRLELTWRARDLRWKFDDFSPAVICYADDVVPVAKTMYAAETMVSETIQEL